MQRVHGPYKHGARWRLEIHGDDGRVRETYESEEEALVALQRHQGTLLMEDAGQTFLSTMLASAVEIAEDACWVYLLRLAGKVVYVGVTGSLQHRLGEHRKNGVEFDSAQALPIPLQRDAALRLEAALIRWLQPPLNTAHAGLGTARKLPSPSPIST